MSINDDKKQSNNHCKDPVYVTFIIISVRHLVQSARKGTAAAVPKPFRPGDPVLCGSHPLVTPY